MKKERKNIFVVLFSLSVMIIFLISFVLADGVNETQGDLLWWRLDGSNLPTGNWDMNGYEFTNAMSIDAEHGAFNSLFANSLEAAQLSVSEIRFDELLECHEGNEVLQTDSDGLIYCGTVPVTSGVNETQGDSLWMRRDGASSPTGDWNFNGYVLTNASFLAADAGAFASVSTDSLDATQITLGSLLACDEDNEILQTDANGVIYCGVAPDTTGFDESYTDTLYWRLDGGNAPVTSNWDMGGFGFENVGLTSFADDIDMNGFSIGGVDSLSTHSLNADEISVEEITTSRLLFDQPTTLNVDAIETSRVVSDCVTSEETISWTDDGAAPKGFYPYGFSKSRMDSAFPVLYEMEIRSFTVLSGGTVVCSGKDALVYHEASCTVAFVMNRSGVRFNPLNITLHNQIMKTSTTSINLSYGDMILPEGFGSTVNARDSQGLSDVTILMRARRRC